MPSTARAATTSLGASPATTRWHRPEFPERFASAEAARAFCHPFFTWYNTEHRHGGIGWLTPAMVHYGQVELVRTARRQILATAYAAHPERFVHRPPEPPAVPDAVWINPPAPNAGPGPRIQQATGPQREGERLSASRIDDLDGGRYLDTPETEAAVVNLATLPSGVRQ